MAAPSHPLPKLTRFSPLLSRSLSSSSLPLSPPPDPHIRSLTPTEKKFRSWTDLLRPGFTPADVDSALRSQSDPDLALDIFRWASLRPNYRHPPSVYHTALQISLSARRFSHAESLLQEILSGAPSSPPDLPLLNALLRFCCSRRHLFSRALDVYNRILSMSTSKSGLTCDNVRVRPDLDTYSMLLQTLLRRLGRPPVAYIHLHAVRSLVRQMKASGVIPDTFVLNLIIKAYSRCLEMNDAIRIFREMPLYGTAPTEYSYGYIVKGLCEKGRVREGMGFFEEMREKGLVPSGSVYMAVVCSLAMEGRFEEGVGVLRDMIGNGMKADLLTYRTLLEGLCRDGRGEDAFELLEELGRTKGAVDRRMYADLLDGLHWLRQPHDAN